MGACVIEKHFTLDNTLPGPDHATSLVPEEFNQMVTSIRSAQAALGSSIKQRTPVERINITTMRRSLVAAMDIARGTILEARHLAMKRPGTGLGAESIPMFIGQQIARGIQKDEAITLDAFTFQS
jgi:N-acetylneuraminate synthase/N,N'-diacetyllegionaminate synthase